MPARVTRFACVALAIAAGAAPAQDVVWQVSPYPGSPNAVPVAMAFVPPSTVYVTGTSDEGGHRIRWTMPVSLAGALLGATTPTAPPGPLANPHAADVPSAIASDGASVYVVSSASSGCAPGGACASVQGSLARHVGPGAPAWSVALPATGPLAVTPSRAVVGASGVLRAYDTTGGPAGADAPLVAGLASPVITSMAPLPGGRLEWVGHVTDPSLPGLDKRRPIRGVFGEPPASGSHVLPGRGWYEHVVADAAGNTFAVLWTPFMGAAISTLESRHVDGTYRGSALPPFAPEGVVVDAAGELIVFGNAGVAKYAPDGALRWHRVPSATVHDVAVDAAGNVYVTGTLGSPPVALVEKIGPLGTRLWSRTLPAKEAIDIVAADGAVVVLATVYSGPPVLFRLSPGAAEPPAAVVTFSAPSVVPPNAPVTFVVTVAGTVAPTGTVTFHYGTFSSVACGPVPLQPAGAGAARAECTIGAGQLSSVGRYEFTAEYSGDALNARSTATAVVLVVSPAAPDPEAVPTLAWGTLVALSLVVLVAGMRYSLRGAAPGANRTRM
jgi:hypothetical protein